MIVIVLTVAMPTPEEKKKINGDRNVNSMEKMALVTVVTVLMTVLLLLLSRFSRIQLCVTPETAARQAPPSLGR